MEALIAIALSILAIGGIIMVVATFVFVAWFILGVWRDMDDKRNKRNKRYTDFWKDI